MQSFIYFAELPIRHLRLSSDAEMSSNIFLRILKTWSLLLFCKFSVAFLKRLLLYRNLCPPIPNLNCQSCYRRIELSFQWSWKKRRHPWSSAVRQRNSLLSQKKEQTGCAAHSLLKKSVIVACVPWLQNKSTSPPESKQNKPNKWKIFRAGLFFS